MSSSHNKSAPAAVAAVNNSTTLQIAPGHRPSSRAVASLASSIASTDDDKTDSDKDIEQDDDNLHKSVARPLPQAQVKNKLLDRATTGSSGTKEYPSPKLGPRSLGASPAGLGQRGVSAPNISQNTKNNILTQSHSANSSLSAANSVEEEESANAPILTEAADLSTTKLEATATPLTKTTNHTDFSHNSADEDDSNDLVKKSSTTDPLAKLKQEAALPVTASPKQFRSSLHLLSLAGKVDESKSNDLPAEGTPKPGYLRRLDSPDSHHGQLIKAKATLQILVNKALQSVPNIKLSAAPKIKASIEQALSKLEASCVSP
jgi:hypothetical protein